MWADLVPRITTIAKRPWRWNDTEKASNVLDAERTPWVFCAINAAGANELCR